MSEGRPGREKPDRAAIATLETEAMNYLRRGDFTAARARYQKLVALDPKNADAHAMLGVACQRTGDLESAKSALSTATRLDPDNAAHHANLGNVLNACGETAAALQEFDVAIALDGDNALVHNDRGNALSAAGDLAAAIDSYRRALTLRPSYARAHFNLANALKAAYRTDDAIAEYKRAIDADPLYASAYVNLGNALRDADQPQEAIAAYRRAIGTDPGLAPAHYNLGVLLREEGALADAIAHLRRAVTLDPGAAAALTDLGVALWRHGDRQEAEDIFQNTLTRHPENADAQVNLAAVHRWNGRLDAALEALDRALETKPDHRDARLKRGLIRLLQRQFDDGWDDYLSRDSIPAEGHGLDRDRLNPELSGRRILVERDQGLGDEVFFLRFMPALRRRGTVVTYRCDTRLAEMLRRADIAHDVVGQTDEIPASDLRVSLGDLPYLLGPLRNNAVPAPISLTPLADRTAAIRRRLASLGPPPYVACTWRGGTRGNDLGLFKEVRPEALAETISGLDATFLCVQRKPALGEIEVFETALQSRFHDLSALNDDLEDMLALMAEARCLCDGEQHQRSPPRCLRTGQPRARRQPARFPLDGGGGSVALVPRLPALPPVRRWRLVCRAGTATRRAAPVARRLNSHLLQQNAVTPDRLAGIASNVVLFAG